jgi:hypothetical protein
MEHLTEMPLPNLTFEQPYPDPVLRALSVKVCHSFWDRLRGIRKPGAGDALLFPGTRGLHGLGINESLWVIWLDKDYRVVSTEWLHPGGFTMRPEGALHAVEVTLDGIEEAVCGSVH